MAVDGFSTVVQHARRREVIDRALRCAGWGFAIGAAAACATLLAVRFAGMESSATWLVILPAAGFLTGAVLAIVRRPPALLTAVRIDRALRLNDRLGSAQALDDVHSAHVDRDFHDLLVADARRLAKAIDVRPVTPVRITGIWGFAATLAVLLGLGIALIPARAKTASESLTPEQIALLQPQAQQVAQVIETSIKDLPRNDASLDARSRDDVAALDKLADQLTHPATSANDLDKTRDETAARMNELADRLNDQSQRDQAASDALAQKFSGLDSTGAPKPPMSADEFHQALTRGDFGAAAEELQRLLDHPEQLPPGQQQAVADHLRDTASRVKNDAQRDTSAKERQAQVEQALRDQGFTPEQIERMEQMLREHPETAEALRRALEQQNFDPEAADKLARDLQQMDEDRRTDEQVQRDLKDIGQSLDRAADDIQKPPEPATQPAAPPQTEPPASVPQQDSNQTTAPQQPASQPQSPTNSSDPKRAPDKNNETTPPQRDQQDQSPSQQQKQDSQQATGDRTNQSTPATRPQQSKPESNQSSQSDQPSQQTQPSQSPSQQQQRQQSTTQPQPDSSPRNSAQSQPNGQPKPQNASASQPSGRDQQSPQQQGDQPQQQSSNQQQPPDQTAKSQSRQSDDQNQGGQTQPKPRPRPQPQAVPRPQPTPGQSPDRGAPVRVPTADETKNGDAKPEPPAETLRRMAERQSTAKDRQQMADRLRKTAQDLAKRMTPEEREQWARQWQKQNEQPPNTNGAEHADQPPVNAAAHRPMIDHPNGSPAGRAAGQPSADDRTPALTDAKPDDVDIRGNEIGDQPLTDFLDNPPADASRAKAPTQSASPAERIRAAQQVAERAVNDSAVPSRYHQFIKRVFGNLNKAAAPSPSPPPPATQP